jgi:hypothetical protein
MHLRLGLSAALETGNCVLFLGSGIGFNLTDYSGDPAPTGDQLAKEMAEAFEIDTEGNNDLALVSQSWNAAMGAIDSIPTLRLD